MSKSSTEGKILKKRVHIVLNAFKKCIQIVYICSFFSVDKKSIVGYNNNSYLWLKIRKKGEYNG